VCCTVVCRRCRARHGCNVGRERLQNADDLLSLNGLWSNWQHWKTRQGQRHTYVQSWLLWFADENARFTAAYSMQILIFKISSSSNCFYAKQWLWNNTTDGMVAAMQTAARSRWARARRCTQDVSSSSQCRTAAGSFYTTVISVSTTWTSCSTPSSLATVYSRRSGSGLPLKFTRSFLSTFSRFLLLLLSQLEIIELATT